MERSTSRDPEDWLGRPTLVRLGCEFEIELLQAALCFRPDNLEALFALAAGARPAGGVLRMTIYAVGGAELDVADSGMVPDSAVFVAHADPGGTLGVV